MRARRRSERPTAIASVVVRTSVTTLGAKPVSVISSSPVVAMVLEGPNAIAVVRAMVGATRPHEAAPGTIRGDFALVGLRNLVHASDAADTARTEIALWFPSGVVEYTRDVERWMTEDRA